MKTISLLKACLLVVLVSGCGDDGLADLFIPNFSNEWKSSRNTSFFFNPAESGVSEGTFPGVERIDENDTNPDEFEGSFTNSTIEFTFINGDEAGVKYSGRFVDDKTIKVKGTNNVQLTLVRN